MEINILIRSDQIRYIPDSAQKQFTEITVKKKIKNERTQRQTTDVQVSPQQMSDQFHKKM